MKRNSYILVLLVGMISGCVSFGVSTLSDDNYLDLENPKESKYIQGSSPIEKYNGSGVIADFEKENIGNWWGSSKIVLSKKDGDLLINASGVGKEYDRFGYTFIPSVDFSNQQILKVRVKAEGNMIPTLRIDLKDKNGHVTNSKDSKARLVLCNEYIEYFFRYEGRFKQGWPYKADVDPKNISELEIFINPGGQNFTGTIRIDDISSVTEKQMWDVIENMQAPCDVSPNNKFENDVRFCWSNSGLYLISHEDHALKVESKGAGNGWESFGLGFSMVDLGQRPVLRIRAKVKGKQAAQLRVDLVDFAGNVTNGEAIEFTITNDDIYKDYYFEYEDKLFQGWPQATKVNGAYLNELMFFTNPGGPAFLGELFIDEIEVINDFVKAESSTHFSNVKDAPKIVGLYDSKTSDNTWWQIVKNGTMQFGTGFDPVNLQVHPSFMLSLSTADYVDGLQLEVMDNRGVRSGEISPVYVEEIDGFVNVHYNLSELDLSVNRMNVSMITGCVFHQSGGTEKYPEIKAMWVQK